MATNSFITVRSSSRLLDDKRSNEPDEPIPITGTISPVDGIARLIIAFSAASGAS